MINDVHLSEITSTDIPKQFLACYLLLKKMPFGGLLHVPIIQDLQLNDT
jgi:hypothetical protein